MESLAVKYRPKEFSDVCSQLSIIRILKQQLEVNQFKNCMLFCGPSGCGKTSLSRLFANKINKGQGEPIEIDAASNNGVDNVREIVRASKERSIDSEYKIYIIDECHVLSSSAWQAFLKCIEEPPKYTLFFFCTTNPEKIPDTILNRLQRYNLNRIPIHEIKQRLIYISRKENFNFEEEAIDFIAKTSKGQMRDAIATLEKCASYSNDINIDNVLECLGNFTYNTFFNLINSIIDDNEQEILKIVNDYYNSGNNLSIFIDQFLDFCFDINKYIIFKDFSCIKIPNLFKEELDKSINFENPGNYYSYVVDGLLDLKFKLKNDVTPKTTIEITLLKFARCG